MNYKEMLKALQRPGKTAPPLQPLETAWGEGLDPNHVLEEYPRPQMVRNNYEILNGYWRYAITETGEYPKAFDGLILVPFSPESTLSGVGRQLLPQQYLWYERVVDIRDHKPGNRCLIHFEAVDQCAHIFIDGQCIKKHMGGYLPFEVDVTPFLTEGDNHLCLAVRVQDFSDTSWHSRGKQKLKPGGMYYTAQSGIWQTVWMEMVPERYITALEITPDYDAEQVTLSVTENESVKSPWMHVKIYNPRMRYCGRIKHGSPMGLDSHGPIRNRVLLEKDFGSRKATLDIPDVKCWTPQTPYLYPVEITLGQDTVWGYFAMRCFTIEKDGRGIPRICVNHKATFLNGVLDQGYWPDGLYTAPSDDALIYDIRKMKQLGFNMLRKHAKIESRRWYFHCDRLGMIVWQDMVNGGSTYSPLRLTYLPTLLGSPPRRHSPGDANCTHRADDDKCALRANDAALKSGGGCPICRKARKLLRAPADAFDHWFTSRSDARGRREFMDECVRTVNLLKAFPSIMTWVPFNEGWGQFDTLAVERLIRRLDSTRLVDHASGWFDRNGGDFKSVHNYFFKLKVRRDHRAFVLSEYGGYTFRIHRHTAAGKTYGYRAFTSYQDFQRAWARLMLHDIKPMIDDGLCAAVYTQLSDIEEEINGLLTYDRKVCKLSRKTIKYIGRRLP